MEGGGGAGDGRKGREIEEIEERTRGVGCQREVQLVVFAASLLDFLKDSYMTILKKIRLYRIHVFRTRAEKMSFTLATQ